MLGIRRRLKTKYLFLTTNHNITHGRGRPFWAETKWSKEVKMVERQVLSALGWVASKANNEIKIWGQVYFSRGDPRKHRWRSGERKRNREIKMCQRVGYSRKQQELRPMNTFSGTLQSTCQNSPCHHPATKKRGTRVSIHHIHSPPSFLLLKTWHLWASPGESWASPQTRIRQSSPNWQSRYPGFCGGKL